MKKLAMIEKAEEMRTRAVKFFAAEGPNSEEGAHCYAFLDGLAFAAENSDRKLFEKINPLIVEAARARIAARAAWR